MGNKIALLTELCTLIETRKNLKLADEILDIAKGAGELIMEVYNNPTLSKDVQIKSDNSPLTMADNKSHELIMEKLSAISEYPIISEESSAIDYVDRKDWSKLWLVDPLDGTKEFINRNGELSLLICTSLLSVGLL